MTRRSTAAASAGSSGPSDTPGRPSRVRRGGTAGKDAGETSGSASSGSARSPGGAGRVIAGVARGRRLAAPGEGTRPLGDRMKQSLFGILEPELRGRQFLDLFAGSGAAGIEALSRGAGRAVFVERNRSAVQTIERNLRNAGLLGPGAVIVPSDVLKWLASDPPTGAFAAILVDPPYDQPELLERAIEGVASAGPDGILAGDGVVVAKHFQKAPQSAEIGLLRSVREARFGDTVLTFYRWASQEDA